ncbi:hypothetical protein IAE37_001158 [Pseudomonas sp. S31]|uniref:hypothetical protein n=1 Tax=Pseudomonas sp. S31 TaxID=1564473 RepID=UPI001911B49E|nr:hypothetical protein [Pseudomonas sp. S31]MBK4998882.1 hypothetical protein [Pseudomonas sp. S31]
MAVFMVTWNLNKERSNYAQARTAFIQHLERYQNVKDPGLESVRWISLNATAEQVCTDLRAKIDANDRIFVTQITAGTHQGWLEKAVWDWINARL